MQVKTKISVLRIIKTNATFSFLKNLSSEILSHPEVGGLLSIIEDLSLEIEHLKKEIRMLKGHSAKPTIPPNSNLEGQRKLLKKGKKTLLLKRPRNQSWSFMPLSG